MNFTYLGMHIFCLHHCGFHSFKVLHDKWCSLHYVYIMWEEIIETINRPKKKMYYFPKFFSLWFFFWLKNILICVLIIWLNFMHHIIVTYSLCYMISTNLYIYKHVLSNMDICLFKNRKIKIYIFVKLFN